MEALHFLPLGRQEETHQAVSDKSKQDPIEQKNQILLNGLIFLIYRIRCTLLRSVDVIACLILQVVSFFYLFQYRLHQKRNLFKVEFQNTKPGSQCDSARK